MNYKSRHEKTIKALNNATQHNFVEAISSIEYKLQAPITEQSQSLVPQEANFQLPNVFLKTKSCYKVEKLFSEFGKQWTGKESSTWNKKIDQIIDKMDEIELEAAEITEQLECDEKILETLLNWRSGKLSVQPPKN